MDSRARRIARRVGGCPGAQQLTVYPPRHLRHTIKYLRLISTLESKVSWIHNEGTESDWRSPAGFNYVRCFRCQAATSCSTSVVT